MAYDFDGQELASILGSNMKSAADYKESFVTTENSSNLQFVNIDTIEVTGSYYVYKKNLKSDSFVLDHPVYGELDSSILIIDGGYAVTQTASSTFPLSFPIIFTITVAGSSLVSSGLL